MTVFPALLIENLPNFLRHDAKKTANFLLGQDRQAIMFWRLHSNLPIFLVVFRHKEDRDVFFRSKIVQEVRLNNNRNQILETRFYEGEDLCSFSCNISLIKNIRDRRPPPRQKKKIAAPRRKIPLLPSPAPPRPARGSGQNCGAFAGQNENSKKAQNFHKCL